MKSNLPIDEAIYEQGYNQAIKDLQHETFVAAVKDMRQLQKKYFETRNPNVLTNARKAERVVDRLLNEQEQLSFF